MLGIHLKKKLLVLFACLCIVLTVYFGCYFSIRRFRDLGISVGNVDYSDSTKLLLPVRSIIYFKDKDIGEAMYNQTVTQNASGGNLLSVTRYKNCIIIEDKRDQSKILSIFLPIEYYELRLRIQ